MEVRLPCMYSPFSTFVGCTIALTLLPQKLKGPTFNIITNYSGEDCMYDIINKHSVNFTISAHITHRTTLYAVTISCKFISYYDAFFLRFELLYSNIFIKMSVKCLSNYVLL